MVGRSTWLLLLLFVFQSSLLTPGSAKPKKKSQEEKYDPKSKPGHFTCPQCGRSFKTESQLEQHLRDTKHIKKINDDKSDNRAQEANSHEKTAGETNAKSNAGDSKNKLQRQDSIDRSENAAKLSSTRKRRASIDKIEKDSIAIDKNEKKSASQDYSYYIHKILQHIQTLKGGKIYSQEFYKAGSHSAKTKIGKADEFDVIIPVKFDVKSIRTEGKVPYIYEDKKRLDEKPSSTYDMKSERKIKDILTNPQDIPHSRAVVEVKNPEDIQHLTEKSEVIPHKLLQDFHAKLETSIKEKGLSSVHLSPTSHGPALTITIKQSIDNNINVDLVLSIPCSKTLPMPATWPRKKTRQAFWDQRKIQAAIDAGIHLVPKGDETWTISYSKAEKELLEGIDKGNECRRQVLRLIKYYLTLCKEESADGLPGLSSHIVKTQILWSNENRLEPGYWSQKTKDVCLLDTIDDMVSSLENAYLPDYFDEKINILAQKNMSELKAFSKCLMEHKRELEGSDVKDEL